MIERVEGKGEEPAAPTYWEAIEAVKGDQFAMLALLRRIRPRLVRWFDRRLGARLRSRTDAEDLAQDSLLEICQRLPNFEPRGQREFRAWLRVILKHQISAAARRKETLPDGRDPIDSSVPGQQETPSEIAMGTELHRLVEQSLGSLPASHAEILRVSLYEQLKPEQIAERFGITAGNARVRLHRARAALQEDLEQRLGPDHPIRL